MKKKIIMLSMLAITAAMLTACSDKNDAADVPEVSQAEESTEKGTVMTVTFPLNREYKDD